MTSGVKGISLLTSLIALFVTFT